MEYVIREEDAENMVHDVFLELWEERRFMGTHINLSAFLFTTVRNKCIDFLRRKTIELSAVEKMQEEYRIQLHLKYESLEAFDEKIFNENTIESIIDTALDELPERCRRIFIMNKFEGKKQKVIAQELNISVNTVESQMAIAYKKLKENLKDYFPLFLFFF